MAEPAKKKQCLLTSFLAGDSFEEAEELSTDGGERSTETGESSIEDQPSGSFVSGITKKRTFLFHWTKIYPWLLMEGTGEDITVYCRDCKKAGLTNDFAKGKKTPGKGWKKEYLQRHADSNQHLLHALPTVKTAEQAKSRNMFSSKSATEMQTVGLLHNVYFMVKNGLPVYKSTPLHSLLDFQLEFYCDESQHDHERQRSFLSSTHRTKHSTWEFVHALNSVVEDNDVMKLKQANFFSLLLDESNDISVTKNLMLYVQFVNPTLHSVEVMFLKSIPFHNCDADSISTAIVEFFKTKDVDLEKMMMFTSDGAAVMLGRNNGVHIKLKAICPHLLEYHCVAHREALAAGDAYKSVAYFVQLESTIKAIYSHFSHSSVRTANVKYLSGVLDKKYIRLRKIHDIRWLSRLEAVEAVVKSYEVLVTYFEDLSSSDVVASVED